MILLGFGSNLAGPWGSPAETLERAIDEIETCGLHVVARSAWYLSAPFGRTDQPAFVNGALAVETHISPPAVLARCHQVERNAGRLRRSRWGPRVLDIDLLAYHGRVIPDRRGRRARNQGLHTGLVLPHPGIAERPFVLEPICEIAPAWRHPVSHLTAAQMLEKLRGQQQGVVLSKA